MDVRGTAMTDVTAHARSVFSPGRPTSSSHFFFAKYIHEMQFLLGTEGVTNSLECFLAELNCSSFCTVDLC